jgi:hypothetical protein
MHTDTCGTGGWDLADCGWDLAEFWGWDLAVWLERLTANAVVATVLGSIPASSDTVKSKGRQMKQCWILYIKNPKNSPFKVFSVLTNVSSSWFIYVDPLLHCLANIKRLALLSLIHSYKPTPISSPPLWVTISKPADRTRMILRDAFSLKKIRLGLSISFWRVGGRGVSYSYATHRFKILQISTEQFPWCLDCALRSLHYSLKLVEVLFRAKNKMKVKSKNWPEFFFHWKLSLQ